MSGKSKKPRGSAVAIFAAIIIVVFGLRMLVEARDGQGGATAREVIEQITAQGEFPVGTTRSTTPRTSPKVEKPAKEAKGPETDKLNRSDREELNELLDKVVE